MSENYDAVVVGSGPNGLAAAITLAQAKCSVLLIEANNKVGGSCVSEELTLQGFIHDVCSAIHPLALASPFFRSLSLKRSELRWIQPDVPLAHPLDNGRSVLLYQSLTTQAASLEKDGESWLKAMGFLVADWEKLLSDALQPPLHLPRHPLLQLKFATKALQPAAYLARRLFQNDQAQALFAGLAAHSFLDLKRSGSSAIGLILATLAHAVGWPMPEGGAGKIMGALAAYFEDLGGKIITNQIITNIDELPKARAVFLDLTPRQVLQIARHRLPAGYCQKLENYRYGPAAFKIDFALSSPVPWTNPNCSKAGTVHVCGNLSEIVDAEKRVARGQMPQHPFVLFAQHTMFDKTRAPASKHTGWAYCHVPHGYDQDASGLIESQIERFASGFKDCIMARSVRGPKLLEQYNPNLIGGDINGGLADLRQIIARPVLSANPYRTPLKGLFICSASTPPGGGVHGMCGYNAALRYLREVAS